MHGVTEAGLVRLAAVIPTVIAADLEAVAGLDLGWDGVPIVEPAGRAVPRGVGPLAAQSHVVLLEQVDPRGLEAEHGLRESC